MKKNLLIVAILLIAVAATLIFWSTPLDEPILNDETHRTSNPQNVLNECMFLANGTVIDGSISQKMVNDLSSQITNINNKAKRYDDTNRTIVICDSNTKEDMMTIELISSEPDLCTFTEVFEVAALESYTPDILTDFRARTVKHNGINNVHAVEWFLECNVSYIVNITDYKIVQVEEDVYNNKTGKNETVLVNTTIISGYHDETRYKNVWQKYVFDSKVVSSATTQRFKVIYHKKPELGDVRIQTIPMFAGVECEELTWWNTSFSNRKNITLSHTGALTDYQSKLNISYESSMQVDFDDLRFVDTSDTSIPYWIESKTNSSTADVWIKYNQTDGDTYIWMYYGNDTISSGSSGTDVFIQYNGITTAQYLKSVIIPTSQDLRYKTKMKGTGSIKAGISNNQNFATDDSNYCQIHAAATYHSTYNDASISYGYNPAVHTDNTYRIYEGLFLTGVNSKGYFDNILIATHTTNLPNENVGLGLQIETGSGAQEWAFLSKYTATEPTYSIGTEESSSTITAYTPPTPLQKTGGDSQTFTVNTSKNTQCRWYINGSLMLTNTTGATQHAYTNTSLNEGYWNFTATVNTTSMTSSQTWWVTVKPKYIPPAPTNLANTKGVYFINYTWDAGTGNITDSYAVLFNDVWYNGSDTWRKFNVSPDTWGNITVWGMNGTTLSENSISDNVFLESFKPPTPINLMNTTGNFWIKHIWNAGSGDAADSYNVSVNGTWFNTTDTFYNDTYAAHGWQNITVWAWNNTLGERSDSNVSQNTQIPNNVPVLTNYDLIYDIQEFDTISIDFDFTDADSDTCTFATDAANGTFNTATGVYSWTTTWMERGTYHFTFNVSDGYGGVDSATIEIKVTAYPLTDLEENWQYHEDADPSDKWAGGITIVNVEGTHSKVACFYTALTVCDYINTPPPPYQSSSNSFNSIEPMISDYWAFTLRDCSVSSGGLIGWQSNTYIRFYDIEGIYMSEAHMTISSNSRYEYSVVENNVYLRIDGDNKGIQTTVTSDVAYIGFRTYLRGKWYDPPGSCGTGYSKFYFDDITTDTAINGIGVSHSDAPQYDNTHTWANSELWTVDPEIDVTYGLKTTPIADYTAANYSMKVQKVLTSEYVDTTIIKTAGEAPCDATPPHGVLVYNQTTLFGDNYGTYNFIVERDGSIVATDWIYWMNVELSGNSYVDVAGPRYPAGAQVDASYYIDNMNLAAYKYYIKTISMYGTQEAISENLIVDTGSVTIDTLGFDVMSYWVILVREDISDGSANEMASDMFAITDTISAEGTVYNAESGTAIGDAKVSLYQNGIWFNTTSDSTSGEYNLTDMSTDIDITVYAEKAGYVHESFTFTPLEAGVIGLDIYMLPESDAISHNSTAIGGIVTSAPYHQAINGAEVTVYNATWSDNRTASVTGYYLFDDLITGTYTGNAAAEAYTTTADESIITITGNYTYQNYNLQPINILTVKAKDAETHVTISEFSVIFDEGVTYSTTDGSLNITTGIGIYKLEISADGYYGAIDYVTVVDDTEKIVYLYPEADSGSGTYYAPHYVKFIVQSLLFTKYSGVVVNVSSIGPAGTTEYMSDITGTDGAVVFELTEDIYYTITFIDAAQGINEEWKGFPVDTLYRIIVLDTNIIPDEPAINDILFGCYGQSINMTHGYINVSFEDISGTTTLAEMWINDTNMTNLYYFNTSNNTAIWSQVVTGGTSSYAIAFKLINTEMSEPLFINRLIRFDDYARIDLGLDEGWKYQLIAVLIISTIALLGSALNAEKMAVVTVLVGWLMISFGWLQAGATVPERITLGLMMLFATLIAFGSAIRAGDTR